MADLLARIKPKKSSTPGEIPLAADLEVSELAVNTADGKLFTKHTDNSIKEIGGGASNIVDQGDYSPRYNSNAPVWSMRLRSVVPNPASLAAGEGVIDAPFYAYLSVRKIDHNGVDRSSALAGLVLNNVLTFTYNNGASTVQKTIGDDISDHGSYISFKVNNSSEPWTDGELVMITGGTLTANPIAIPKSTGDLVTWNGITGKFEPTPLRITGTAPATSSATGTAGELRLDANYLYACVATNTWKRTALSTWTPPDTTVSLLLRMNGTSGSASFSDVSTYAHAVTANGSAQVSTSTVKFGSGALQGVGGSGSTGYLSVPDHESLEFGSGDFTIELFVNFNSVASVQSLISKGYAGTANMSWALFRDASRGTLQLTVSTDGSGDTRKEVTWAPSTGVWYHVAVTRSSGSLRFFVDGTQVEGVVASSENYFNGGGQTRVGWAVNFGLDGFIDEVRLTKGVARYTSNFTAPTAEFPSPS